ncbi:MAG: response regulator transcription factor [Burkholderiales bacterium]|nr:response regulator transcription factor [Burkholderiales bacterium]
MTSIATPVRVMIVEDDLVTLERFAAAMMRDPRLRVVEKVRTARGAIARLQAASPDVLLVDLGLPDAHGTEVIRDTVRRLPACDIMVISMFGDERNVMASIEAGATGYVLKDCADADLVARVLELRAGGSPMSPGIARIVLERMKSGMREAGRPAVDGDAPATLTAREADVLRLLSRGYTYAEIAGQLRISAHTVGSHIKKSYRKLKVHSGAAAVTRAAELGLLRNGPGTGPAR